MLQPGGYFYLVVPHYPPGDWKDGQYEEIEEHTYTPTDGFEQGIAHYFFTEDELSAALGEYEVLEIMKESISRLCALVRKAV